MKALIVDDEPAVRDSLRRVLAADRYEVETAADGIEALTKIESVSPDVVILDVLMPEMSGLEVCRRLRVVGNGTPILMLTAREAVSDRVAGLDAGADDYLAKPFALEELLARLRALLRRTSVEGSTARLSFADLTLDLRTREASRSGRRIVLTRTEFLLLELFLRNPRQVMTRTMIFEHVWGFDLSDSSNSLGVYVGRRLAILSGTAVAIAVAAASVGLYLSARGALLHEVDQSLLSRLEALDTDRIGREPPDARPQTGFGTVDDPLESDQPFGGTEVFAQIVAAGAVGLAPPQASGALPVGDHERAVAAGSEPAFFADVRLEGQHLRVLTGQIRPGLAAQLARPLTEVDATLSRMRWILAGITGAGLLLGAVSGRLVARSAIGPIRRLGLATRRVRSTSDLSARVGVTGRDELGELANDFNAMLEALEASHRSQRGLVADASHELRTPVTSLRTYLEFLHREPDLPAAERDQVLGHAVDQVEELTGLISDLVELARGAEQPVSREPLRLDLLVQDAVERAKRRSRPVEVETNFGPVAVNGSPDLLLRAVNNLLDNAVKWSPPGAPIEVTVVGGTVTVRDHGPGIAAEDLPRVFDRFYRSREARALPGSGLGLAIVKHVAEAHGGTASAANAPGGGAVLTLDLSAALLDVSDLADGVPALHGA